MKKSIKLFIPLCLLGALLCGCSCDNGKTEVMPSASPIISPMPSADVENGIVKDDDGMIENDEQNKDDKGSAADKNNMLEENVILSPAPTMSPKPVSPEK